MERYFQILGVPSDATFEQVKEAYRVLAMVWHPDRFAGNERIQAKATEKIKEVNEAYERLREYYQSSSHIRYTQRPTPGRPNRDRQSSRSKSDSEHPPSANPPESVSPTQRSKTHSTFYVVMALLGLIALLLILFEGADRGGNTLTQETLPQRILEEQSSQSTPDFQQQTTTERPVSDTGSTSPQSSDEIDLSPVSANHTATKDPVTKPSLNGQASRKPDLSGLSSLERQSIEGACGYDKRNNGPAAYYRCLTSQLTQFQQAPPKPDLSGLSSLERQSIEGACGYDKRNNGPAAYYRCLTSQLTQFQQAPPKPDLSGLSSLERQSIEDACGYDKRNNGPAAYYRCLTSQLRMLKESNR